MSEHISNGWGAEGHRPARLAAERAVQNSRREERGGERLLTLLEVEGILQIPVKSLYKMVDAGTLKVIRIGRRIRVKNSHLEEFIGSCER